MFDSTIPHDEGAEAPTLWDTPLDPGHDLAPLHSRVSTVLLLLVVAIVVGGLWWIFAG